MGIRTNRMGIRTVEKFESESPKIVEKFESESPKIVEKFESESPKIVVGLQGQGVGAEDWVLTVKTG